MKFRKPISLLVLCIAALSLIATTCGIFSKQGPGEHYFTSIHGQTITIYGKGIYGNNSVSVSTSNKLLSFCKCMKRSK